MGTAWCCLFRGPILIRSGSAISYQTVTIYRHPTWYLQARLRQVLKVQTPVTLMPGQPIFTDLASSKAPTLIDFRYRPALTANSISTQIQTLYRPLPSTTSSSRTSLLPTVHHVTPETFMTLDTVSLYAPLTAYRCFQKVSRSVLSVTLPTISSSVLTTRPVNVPYSITNQVGAQNVSHVIPIASAARVRGKINAWRAIPSLQQGQTRF